MTNAQRAMEFVLQVESITLAELREMAEKKYPGEGLKIGRGLDKLSENYLIVKKVQRRICASSGRISHPWTLLKRA